MRISAAALRLLGIGQLLLVVIFGQRAVTPDELEARERELTSFLQAHLKSYKDQRTVGAMRFPLAKGFYQDGAAATTTAQALNVPAAAEAIPPVFFNRAQQTISEAGLSTPTPEAAQINAPPKPATATPYQKVIQEVAQPLDTRIGGAVMYGISGGVTPTPPPKQAAISQQFIAQCPMVMFSKDLSIRGQTCGAKEGRWVDPNPLNPNRTVLRWRPSGASGITFGVDSAITGPGTALFADINQKLTLTGYSFLLKNCLGVERYTVEENVYKVDSMGKVSSTMELHDITLNSEAFFLKYLIRSPAGAIVAESTLFRVNQDSVNFTAYSNGLSTDKLLAVATRQGEWTKKGWNQCMAPSSPRGWNIHFPQNTKSFATPATVQDIRVAIATAITLMGYRDENRGADGLNREGRGQEISVLVGGAGLVLLISILTCNFCMVFRSSGLQQKLKRILFDSQGAILPKRPYQHRMPPLHASY